MRVTFQLAFDSACDFKSYLRRLDTKCWLIIDCSEENRQLELAFRPPMIWF